MDYQIIKFLGKGKSGYSYLIKDKDVDRVLKIIHNEPCPYYAFGDKFKSEIHAYQKLKAMNIPIPELIEENEPENYMIKEYIEGKTVAELIAQDSIESWHIEQIFKICKILYINGINIDYFPTNFVANHNKLFYVDYEINQYSEEWNFENWGIYYWANSKGMKEFLETRDVLKINIDNTSGKPIKDNGNKIANWLRIREKFFK